MNIAQNQFMAFAGMTPQEAILLQEGTAGLDETQTNCFFAYYEVKRKDPNSILLLTVIGTLGIAGLQRFAIGQIALGFLYLFTFGFFWIGTVLDLINYKRLAAEYNHKMAYESFEMAKITS